jgi:hypothetical protein
MKRQLLVLLIVTIIMPLSACSALIDPGPSRSKHNALAVSNYAAADMLIQQSRSFITTETPLMIRPIKDLDYPDEYTNFGRLVSEQIASRFVQLGYNVTTQTSTDQDPGNTPNVNTYISGHYAVARDALIVHLQVLASETGKVLAAYDYSVAKTRDVRELAKTREQKNSFFDF